MVRLYPERGFKRLTWVVSVSLAVFFAGEALSLWQADRDAAYGFIAFAAIAFVASWVVFFVLRWIVRGFIEAPVEGPPPSQPPGDAPH